MPKVIDTKNRMDTDIRIRVSYTLQAKVKSLANSRKISVAELCRQLLQAEIDKAK